jgi:hypothetical protein
VSGVPGRLEPPAAGRQADARATRADGLGRRWPDGPSQARGPLAELAGPGTPGDWHAALARALQIGLLELDWEPPEA